MASCRRMQSQEHEEKTCLGSIAWLCGAYSTLATASMLRHGRHAVWLDASCQQQADSPGILTAVAICYKLFGCCAFWGILVLDRSLFF